MSSRPIRPSAEPGEASIGILLLDYEGAGDPGDGASDRPLGDVGNAASFDYPVIYHRVKGLTFERVLEGGDECESLVVEAARKLVDLGVSGISSDCGFLVSFQEAVSRAVHVPVLLSSMLQLPIVAAGCGSERPVLLITSTDEGFDRCILERVGMSAESSVIVKGLQAEPHFRGAILEGRLELLDWGEIGREVVRVVRESIRMEPRIGAIVFECTLLPPYRGLVQEATGLPVFDIITMIDFLHAGSHQCDR